MRSKSAFVLPSSLTTRSNAVPRSNTRPTVAPAKLVFQTQALPAAIASIVIAVVIGLAAFGTDWGAVEQRIVATTNEIARTLFDHHGCGLLYVLGGEDLPASQREGDVEVVRLT